ncbi:MAG: energy-coupling factor transporter transmembrane component T [Oscillospiraceae bacterium]|nr:energy-coupling factor transporter transmembrane component T [Oscillospiraceae bacterium]
MSGLPTGMFLPGSSLIHRIDARVKFLALLLFITAVVCADSPAGYVLMLAFTGAALLLSELPLKTAVGSAGRLVWFFAVILVMNTCFYGPEKPWVSFWIFKPSYKGLVQGFDVIFRVGLVLVAGNVLTLTTPPMELTRALQRLISPLRYLGIPAEQIAMIISVAIQFIPTLFEETDMIRKAQTARGARFDSRKLSEKAGAVMPLVVPIFLAAFKRADELSLAMEARGYTTEKGRTRKKPKPLNGLDIGTLLLVSGVCAAEIFLR